MVQCRPNTQLRLDLTNPNSNGAVVAFDIFVLEGGREHTLFSFRNQGTLARGFTVRVSENNYVKIWRDSGAGWESVASANPLNLSKSNLFFI